MRVFGIFLLLAIICLCNKKVTNSEVHTAPAAEKGPVFVLGPAAEEKAVPLVSPGGVVYFEFDSYSVTAGSWEAIKKMVVDGDLCVDGYCDQRGTDEYNYALGMKRAEAVAGELRRLGATVEARSFGETGLVRSSCETEDCHQENRRVEVHAK